MNFFLSDQTLVLTEMWHQCNNEIWGLYTKNKKSKLMLSFSFLTTLEPFWRKSAYAVTVCYIHRTGDVCIHVACCYTFFFFISKGYMQGKGQTLLDTSNYKRVLHNSSDNKLLTLKFSWWYITKNSKNHCQHYLANTNKIHHDLGMCLQMDITRQLSRSRGMNRTPPTLHQL